MGLTFTTQASPVTRPVLGFPIRGLGISCGTRITAPSGRGSAKGGRTEVVLGVAGRTVFGSGSRLVSLTAPFRARLAEAAARPASILSAYVTLAGPSRRKGPLTRPSSARPVTTGRAGSSEVASGSNGLMAGSRARKAT